MLETLLPIGTIGFFLWLIWPCKAGRPASSREGSDTETAESANSSTIGIGTGLLGGDIEDAAISRFALGRTPKDAQSSDARDLGTALGQQSSMDFPDRTL